ncbi:lytic transglycosylase domain-containing protein [Novosphingobium rosa]|uniref:lytic transglycosylase domain-containing protein n=1 Tax=Novosphingobium rosa TaxID=76978 RepID=UPI0012ECFA57|nr:lytic transglycosylase domain-containing protein [Novosphingobium rosa]
MGGGAAASTGSGGDAVGQWREIITEASARFGVPSAWIEQVMRAESRGMTIWQGRPITSRAGAMGLMQLMPATWASMRSALGLGGDPYEPRDNILAGTAYLRAMYDRFGYPGLFGAYNAGPGRYRASIRDGRPLPDETRSYLTKVIQATARSGQIAVKGDEPRLEFPRQTGMFVVLINPADRGAIPGNSVSEAPLHDPMFVVRKAP